MSPLEPSNNITASPEYSIIAEHETKTLLKTAFMNVIEILKEEINKSSKQIYKSTNGERK